MMIMFARRGGAKLQKSKPEGRQGFWVCVLDRCKSHSQLLVEILLRVGRSSMNKDPSQSPLKFTRRLHNLVYWVNTRVQDEGHTCALVDLLQWTSNRGPNV